jgi:hypothetical protein
MNLGCPVGPVGQKDLVDQKDPVHLYLQQHLVNLVDLEDQCYLLNQYNLFHHEAHSFLQDQLHLLNQYNQLDLVYLVGLLNLLDL